MHVVEQAVAEIARRQDNVVAREQLVAAGLTRGAIAHRLRSGRMQLMYRGVYLIGPAPPTPMARARAAVLACGADAVLSHRSAAELFGLLHESHGEIHVTVVGRNPGRHPGITIHRPRALAPDEVVKMHDLWVTSVARTLCDVAATEEARECEGAFQEALYRRAVTPRAVAAVLARGPTRRGASVVRSLVQEPRRTRSGGERALLKLIAAAQLPPPQTNVKLHGYTLDFVWPDHGLVVELDGWDGHGHRAAFERDRKRDQVLTAAGLRVLRVTGRQLEREPLAVIARIAQALRFSEFRRIA